MKTKKKKGFTLIEILIVIVILAVLASLVLPRMMAQPERALVAEAINYLGVIRRAQESIVGSTQGNWMNATAAVGGAGDAGWQGIGMGPVSGTSSFSYACVAGAYDAAGAAAGDPGTCTATRSNIPAGNAKNGGTITVRLNTGRVTACGGAYVIVGTADALGTTCA